MGSVGNLFCNEIIVGSPWKERGPGFDSSKEIIDKNIGYMSSVYGEYRDTIAILLSKEPTFMPGSRYLNQLQSTDLGSARCRAVRWMIKAGIHFNFHAPTLCSAANYLDRFLSKSVNKPWKSWMIELLSVACLSIAAKQEEVYVPVLQDLLVEGVEHTFGSTTIQRMELAILSTLEWRMSSVTAFAYIEPMLQHLGINSVLRTFLYARITELLLHTLPNLEFLDFGASILALSSIFCSLEEMVPLEANLHKTKLLELVQVEQHKLERCYKTMEELLVDPLLAPLSSARILIHKNSPPSPVTVTEISETGELNEMDISTYIFDIKKYIKKRANTVQTVRVSLCKSTGKRKKLTENFVHY